MEGIHLKSASDIDKMRAAGRLAAQALCKVDEIIAPGTSTAEIDDLVAQFGADHGAIAATLGYDAKGAAPVPFPASCCTSLNEVVCHGIPSKERRLRDGDIINVDITYIVDGFHGDTSVTFYVGKPSPDAIRVTEVSRNALELGIAQVKPGARIGDIGAAIQSYAEGHGCSVVRDYAGHGVGAHFHEPPSIPHFGTAGRGRRLKPGMTFTIEPMINQGQYEVELQKDGWTVLTADRSLSAQFEHTLLVTESSVEILTARPHDLKHSSGYGDEYLP